MTKILETSFAGLSLSNPIIVASSGLTNTVQKNKELEKAGVGALVLQSLYEEQLSKQSAELLMKSSYFESGDPALAYLEHNHVDYYLQLIRETKAQCTIPVIGSVNCYKDDSWMDFAQQIESAGADAIELNIFVLSTEIYDEPHFLEKTYIRIAQKVKESVRIPVILKIGKYCNHIVHLVDRLYTIGVSGVVLFNRFYQPDIDINKLQMTSGNLFSSSGEISDTLRWTGIISGELPQMPVAASAGVHDWEDVIKCILAGASAVQICSTLYQNGNEIIAAMKQSMEEWMLHMNFGSITEFQGKLNYAHIEDPSLYERIQFIRYFANRD
ncbi:MAG: dihydroorotate dehydrogenase-like protein [Dysgonamonadaceae bacterium]|jgi:dihydroorotate dehydrogenase (fumarate)|nr:dihydroorotate dehydrogenase-like protein [Dysgonamonadaceae bacterium]